MAAGDRSLLEDLIEAQVLAGSVNFPFLRAKAQKLLQSPQGGTSINTAGKSRWRATSCTIQRPLSSSETRTLATITGCLTHLGTGGSDGDAASGILSLVLDYIQSLPTLAVASTAACAVLLSAATSGALEQLFEQVQAVVRHSNYQSTSSWTQEISAAVAEMIVALPSLSPTGGSTASDVAGEVDVSLTKEVEKQVVGGELLRCVAQHWPVADRQVACELLQSLRAEWVNPWLETLQEGRSSATDSPSTGTGTGTGRGRGSVEASGSLSMWECRLVSGAFAIAAAAVDVEVEVEEARSNEDAAAKSHGNGSIVSQAVALQWLACIPPVLEDALGLLQIQRRTSTGTTIGSGSAQQQGERQQEGGGGPQLSRSHIVARLHAAASAASLVASQSARQLAVGGEGMGSLQGKLMDVTDECIRSAWRKVPACEELFRSCLSAAASIALLPPSSSQAQPPPPPPPTQLQSQPQPQPPRDLLLLRLKPILLAATLQMQTQQQAPISSSSSSASADAPPASLSPMLSSVVSTVARLLSAEITASREEMAGNDSNGNKDGNGSGSGGSSGSGGDSAALSSFMLSLTAYLQPQLDSQSTASSPSTSSRLLLQRNLPSALVSITKAMALPPVPLMHTSSSSSSSASSERVHAAAAVAEVVRPALMEAVVSHGGADAHTVNQLLWALTSLVSVGSDVTFKEVSSLLIWRFSKEAAGEGNNVGSLPAMLLQLARQVSSEQQRSDLLVRLLSLACDLSLAAETEGGSKGARVLGPLLPAIAAAAAASRIHPLSLPPSLFPGSPTHKLFRNLWYYLALFHLTPPLSSAAAVRSSHSSAFTRSSPSPPPTSPELAAYEWDPAWATAVRQLAVHTPPLAIPSLSRVDDELELAALHRPGSQRGSGSEAASERQRRELGAAVGGRLDGGTLAGITGVKATSLLSMVHLECLRASAPAALLPPLPSSPSSSLTHDVSQASSSLVPLLAYVSVPNPRSAVRRCLSAVVLRAFSTVIAALLQAPPSLRSSSLALHSSVLLAAVWGHQHQHHHHVGGGGFGGSQEFVRDTARTMLALLRKKFPQILWFPTTFSVLLHEAAASQRGQPANNIFSTAPLSLPSSSSSALLPLGSHASALQNGQQTHHSSAAGGPASLSLVDSSEGEREDGMEVARDWLETALLLAPRHAEALIEECLIYGSPEKNAILHAAVADLLATLQGTKQGGQAVAVRIASSAAEKSRALGYVTGCAAAAAASPTAAAAAGAAAEALPSPSSSSSLATAAQHIASQLESLTSKHDRHHWQRGEGDQQQQQQHAPSGTSPPINNDPSSEHLREVCLQAAAAVVLLSRQEPSPSASSLMHHLLHLLSLLPSRHLSPHTMQAAITAWTWLAAALPHTALTADAAAASVTSGVPPSPTAASISISRLSVWGPVARLWAEQVAAGVGLFRGQEGVEEGPRACVSPSIVAGSSVMEREEGVRGVGGEGEGEGDVHHHGHQHVEEREGRRAVEALQAHEAFVSYLDELVELSSCSVLGTSSAAHQMLNSALANPHSLSRHPAARQPFFHLLRLSLSFIASQAASMAAKRANREAALAAAVAAAGSGATARAPTVLTTSDASARSSGGGGGSLPVPAQAFALRLLQDRTVRAALTWFTTWPGAFDGWVSSPPLSSSPFSSSSSPLPPHLRLFHQQHRAIDAALAVAAFARSVSDIVHQQGERGSPLTAGLPAAVPSPTGPQQSAVHPVWGAVSLDGRPEDGLRRLRLLSLLLFVETEAAAVWAFPLGLSSSTHPSSSYLQQYLRSASSSSLRPPSPSSSDWHPLLRSAWLVSPRIAVLLALRLPSFAVVQAEVAALVQSSPLSVRSIPATLNWLVTIKAVTSDDLALRLLFPAFHRCAVTSALALLLPQFKGHSRVVAYAFRSLQSYPPAAVTHFMPQLVQALRHDHNGLVEEYLLSEANRDNTFAHVLIWQLQGEEANPEASEGDGEEGGGKGEGAGHGSSSKGEEKNILWEIVPRVCQRIIDSFNDRQRAAFEREFSFFDAVTSISGTLRPVPKEERKAAIQPELEKITIPGRDVYLPTDPRKLVRRIVTDSGIPLQSAKKVPIMVSFMVVEREGEEEDDHVDEASLHRQACIFKVGDDCRQDVLALQIISMLRDINEAVGCDLYLFPYGVLPTGYERGIIEVVPHTRSRNQMGDIADGGLFDIFQAEFGPAGSPAFESARHNFIVSCAAYAVASLLIQPKDRHNGNLLVDRVGHLVHIDFGFIFETSPGGNMRFESADFKLSHEMTQIIDPSGTLTSEPWHRFVSLCVKAFLAARPHADAICTIAALMLESGLPCFSIGDALGNLRRRFHPEMSDREAAGFMQAVCVEAYNKWTTAGYDLIQYMQQGIQK